MVTSVTKTWSSFAWGSSYSSYFTVGWWSAWDWPRERKCVVHSSSRSAVLVVAAHAICSLWHLFFFFRMRRSLLLSRVSLSCKSLRSWRAWQVLTLLGFHTGPPSTSMILCSLYASVWAMYHECAFSHVLYHVYLESGAGQHPEWLLWLLWSAHLRNRCFPEVSIEGDNTSRNLKTINGAILCCSPPVMPWLGSWCLWCGNVRD